MQIEIIEMQIENKLNCKIKMKSKCKKENTIEMKM